MVLRRCDDASPAAWIVNSPLPWHDVAKFGPRGFESYARLSYDPEGEGLPGQTYAPHRLNLSDQELIKELCELLAPHTKTPDLCYYCLWTGVPDVSLVANGPPEVRIVNRSYFLFSGGLNEVNLWSRELTLTMPPAAFIWPADRAWLISSDVDQMWAGIRARESVIAEITQAEALTIVRADPDEW